MANWKFWQPRADETPSSDTPQPVSNEVTGPGDELADDDLEDVAGGWDDGTGWDGTEDPDGSW
ncbi:MAG: hypothetical protein AAGI71_10985 [Bacteroidota bacterium]